MTDLIKEILVKFKDHQKATIDQTIFKKGVDHQKKINEILQPKGGRTKADSKVNRRRLVEACHSHRLEEMQDLLDLGVSMSFNETSFPEYLNDEPLNICMKRNFIEGFEELIHRGVISEMKKNKTWTERSWSLAVRTRLFDELNDFDRVKSGEIDPLVYVKNLFHEMSDDDKKNFLRHCIFFNRKQDELKQVALRWIHEQDTAGDCWSAENINAFLFKEGVYCAEWQDVLNQLLKIVNLKKDEENFKHCLRDLSMLWDFGLKEDSVSVLSFCKKNNIPLGKTLTEENLDRKQQYYKNDVLNNLKGFRWLIENGYLKELSTPYLVELIHCFENDKASLLLNHWVCCVEEGQRRGVPMKADFLWGKAIKNDSVLMASLLVDMGIEFHPIEQYNLLSSDFSVKKGKYIPEEWCSTEMKTNHYGQVIFSKELNENEVTLSLLGCIFENKAWNLLMTVIVNQPELIPIIENEPIYKHRLAEGVVSTKVSGNQQENLIYKCLCLLKKMGMSLDGIQTLKGENPLVLLMTEHSSWSHFSKWMELNNEWMYQPVGHHESQTVCDKMKNIYKDDKIAQIEKKLLSKIISQKSPQEEPVVPAQKRLRL